MKKLEASAKIFGGLSILSCLILIPSIITIVLFDKMLIDLNKGGLLILMTIACINQYYRLRIKMIELNRKIKISPEPPSQFSNIIQTNNMLDNLFVKCYNTISFIPDTNTDRKIAQASVLTSLLSFGFLNMSYALMCITFNISYTKPLVALLTVGTIFGIYMYFVTRNKGKKLILKAITTNRNHLLDLIIVSVLTFGLFFVNILIIRHLIH